MTCQLVESKGWKKRWPARLAFILFFIEAISGAAQTPSSVPGHVRGDLRPAARLPASCNDPKALDKRDVTLWRSLALKPSPEGYTSLGNSFAQQENLLCAIPAFQVALELNPAFWEARYNLALALMKKGAPERAAEELRRIVKQRPDFAAGRNALGLVLQRLGDPDAAGEEFKAALQIDPRFATAAYNLARLLGTQNKWGASIYYLKQTLAQSLPSDMVYQLRFALAIALAQNSQYEEAIGLFQQLIRSSPELRGAAPQSGDHLRAPEPVSERSQRIQGRASPGSRQRRCLART
jgi:tetratricopeptide (TPR) repeat protein